jgi:Mn2+/Fe2+ NRAMP family transporter
VKRLLQITLGILSAIGGFVDIGDLVFNAQAGAKFGYSLIWVVLVGVTGIIVYSEMCGRIAAVSGRPVFDLVRERAGFAAGLGTLIAAQVVSLMTCAAEVGGVAIVLQLLTDWPYRVLIVVAVAAFVVISWAAPFGWIEKAFGYGGLTLLVFLVAAIDLGPDWGAALHGAVPSVQGPSYAVYFYFVVGLLGAAMTPYEVYFYSSGAVEDAWSVKDLGTNRITATLGYALGGTLSVAIMAVAAEVFLPRGIDVTFLGTVPLPTATAFGQYGLLLALIGILFAVGGATIETSFAGAYNVAQFFGWEWGKHRRRRDAPRFTLAWLAMLLLALVIAETGVDPVMVTEYSVIFSVVALPLTYLPILLIANDPDYMGEHRNGRFANALGWTYFGVIIAIAVSAIPLMLITNGGTG